MALVRDVVERHNIPSSATNRKPFPNDAGGSSKTGFPVVQHRSKATSAFKRSRLEQGVQRDMNVARERPSNSTPKDGGLKATNLIENTLEDISQSNAEAVEGMTEEERQRERQDIMDQLGAGIGDLMSKVKEARERRAESRVAEGQRLLRNRIRRLTIRDPT
jgi:RNA polymerase II-associated protein 1